MPSKLTLTIDKEVVESAKVYAKEHGRSVSELVENYLRKLAGSKKSEGKKSPVVNRLLGSIKLPDNFDYKTELQNQLVNKK